MDSPGSTSGGSRVASLVHSDMRSVYSYARKGAPFGLVSGGTAWFGFLP